MSDYQDFCEMYGGSTNDPNFMDNWFREYASIECVEKDILKMGKLVHLIKLKATKPAKPVGIIWNKILEKPLECDGANYLNSVEYNDPASWFVRKGFTVRSSKKNGYWYQVIYKDSCNQTYLTELEVKEYESICSELNSDWVFNNIN
jgi:hypothetical protein